MVNIVSYAPIAFLSYYILLIVLGFSNMSDIWFLPIITLVFNVIDGCHNLIFMLFCFTMMNVDMHFD